MKKATFLFLYLCLYFPGNAIMSEEQPSSHSVSESIQPEEAPIHKEHPPKSIIPKPLDFYEDHEMKGIFNILKNRIQKEPFNLVASIIFLFAIVHTFFSTKFTAIGHRLERRHAERVAQRNGKKRHYIGESFDEVDFRAHIMHFFGEVEAVFGLWGVVLAIATIYFYDWNSWVDYITHRVNFTEPMFVVTIMALASARPIIKLAEDTMRLVASLGKKTPAAWWLAILTIGPILGSFITEPAAMTISALLLARQFYDLKPNPRFAYATIGLLFVNVSVGGTLTHFAAPPVLMVAGKWGWDFSFMFTHIGWKAALGIVINNLIYFIIFSKEFARLEKKAEIESHEPIPWDERSDPVPMWITSLHLVFMGWTVFNAHNPFFFVSGFLFYLGFSEATIHHQNRLNMRPPLMVGFFLAALVIHGGLQGWWLAPILGHLSEVPLMIGSAFLTSFNDNAAITYLSSLVPNLTHDMKYAVMVGAIAGGGLTVIANAPNPAGQSILAHFFRDGVSPIGLLTAAIGPTLIVGFIFMLF